MSNYTIDLWEPEQDFEATLEFLFKYQKDNSEWLHAPNPQKVQQKLVECVLEKDYVFLLKQADTLKGILIIVRSTDWWSDKITLVNLVWYVEEDARSLRNLLQFLDLAKECAIIEDKELYVELPYSSANINKVEKISKKLGLRPTAGVLRFNSNV